LPLGVDNRDQSSLDRSERHPTLLTMIGAKKLQARLVEMTLGVFKCNAVLFSVRPVLFRVPFELPTYDVGNGFFLPLIFCALGAADAGTS
jgi:hypothetical protein